MSKQTYWTAAAIALLAAPMLAFPFLRIGAASGARYMSADVHFYVVGLTALAAAVACAVVIGSAQTLRQTRLLFLGLGFFSIAGIFSVHGLATPGIILDQFYLSVSASAWLSAVIGAAFIGLSAVGLPHRIEAVVERNGTWFFGVTVALVFAYIALSVFIADDWLEWLPIQNRNLQFTLGFTGLAITAFAAWRYYQAYQFARLPSQIAMVAALVLLAEVQISMIWGRVWYLDWWLYHGLYGAAFAVLFTGWTIEARRAGTLRAIADALSMRDALALLNRGLESPILHLVDAIEIKDVETLGHVRRVSGYALAIGGRLGLSPNQLRSLVLAAEMHDVGKISIPSSILAKPGPLTDEEYDVIKKHTLRGHEIAQQVSALQRLATIIRHHHERFDGSGYPDGLAGEDIPLLSRIISVADAYDAMISKRPYRPAKGHVEAMAELLRLKGAHFDPACVDAFVAAFEESGNRQMNDRLAA
jgi:HD-GYP domain-containing protein (c-di-GMP phosphodiesterase class II)